MRVYARNGFLVLFYWLVIKLSSYFCEGGEKYYEIPDFSRKLLFFFLETGLVFSLFRRDKKRAPPIRKEGGAVAS